MTLQPPLTRFQVSSALLLSFYLHLQPSTSFLASLANSLEMKSFSHPSPLVHPSTGFCRRLWDDPLTSASPVPALSAPCLNKQPRSMMEDRTLPNSFPLSRNGEAVDLGNRGRSYFTVRLPICLRGPHPLLPRSTSHFHFLSAMFTFLSIPHPLPSLSGISALMGGA